MNEKVTAEHLCKKAYVYIRQSTASQVEHNQESTRRQYRLRERAIELGWSESRVEVVDDDLARSGASAEQRDGFARMISEVALGNVGIVLSIEVSRVARNSTDWYRLLDLCSLTNTLIADEDGIYHPGLFNDRLLLGLKGTMAEAELHVIRARLDGGIRNKAARGELRRGLPVGFVWGELDGEMLLHPDEAVRSGVKLVFDKFAEFGSARRVWVWFQSQEVKLPRQVNNRPEEISWGVPTYNGIHSILKNPVYAGAYVYGKTKTKQYIDENGVICKRTRKVSPDQWQVFIQDHHKGYIDWKTYEMNLEQLGNNTRPISHAASGAVREGCALIQGLAVCGRCARKLRVAYQGRNSTPSYYCESTNIIENRGHRCFSTGGMHIDNAVAAAFLEAVSPAGTRAALIAQESIRKEHDALLDQFGYQVERAQYEVKRAEKRYCAVDPENRLVARSLENQWEQALAELSKTEQALRRKENTLPAPLSDQQREQLRSLGEDLQIVWQAASTTNQDRKKLLRQLVEDITITPPSTPGTVHVMIRWRSGQFTDLNVQLPTRPSPTIKTDEDTVDLVRRLAEHHRDPIIAGVLNRQKRTSATGLPFNANRVASLRRSWGIASYTPPEDQQEIELVTVEQAAKILGVAASTIHRWLANGLIPGKQVTPGAPWRIPMTDSLKAQFIEEAPEGYVTMKQAMQILGVSRQTVYQRVKSGKLKSVHVRKGRYKGLMINILDNNQSLFDEIELA